MSNHALELLNKELKALEDERHGLNEHHMNAVSAEHNARQRLLNIDMKIVDVKEALGIYKAKTYDS